MVKSGTVSGSEWTLEGKPKGIPSRGDGEGTSLKMSAHISVR